MVQATGPGLLQHLWTAIHPLHLEDAPSLQLGDNECQSQLIPCHCPAGSLDLWTHEPQAEGVGVKG